MIIALLGIASTLALPAAEQARGVGVLRAIGMRRGRAGQMTAAVPGTVLRLGLGATMAAAFIRSQQLTVVISAGPSVLCIMIAVLSGLPAAIAPAHRAARMNLVAGITTE